MNFVAISVLAFVAMASPVVAQNSTFFERSSEGWYWYQDPLEDEEPLELTPQLPEPPSTASEPEPKLIIRHAPVPQGPIPGSVAFLREAMPVALDFATDNPSPENVERYFLLQKQAIDKSEVFAEVAKMVATGHPELDEGRRRPRQDTFAKELEQQAEERQREILTSFFRNHALVMFMDRQCSSCSLMAENFYRMQQTHGLVWQSISLDGTLLPPEISDAQSFDAGLAEKLGVTQGGAVFIAIPPNQFVPVTWNPTGGAEIADRVLLVARRAGLITDEEFRATQAVNPRVSAVQPITGQLPDILQRADDYLQNSQGFTLQREPN